MIKVLPLLLISSLFIGVHNVTPDEAESKLNSTSSKRTSLPNTTPIKRVLYSQFHDWESVQYELGGLSKKGIDCSGFVYVTYRIKLGITLPRTTKLQSTTGRVVVQSHLKAGDLVFFKTGLSTRHVGMYIENRQFLHVSSSKGVIISSLDNPYWSKKYWKSTRVEPLQDHNVTL